MKAIVDVPELNNSNTITVNFAVDFGLHAVEVKIGWYIKYIWIEIIWKDVNFCINLIFKKICIKFRIPIGFRFVYKLKEEGRMMKGKEIMKKRLLELKIL